MRISIDLPDPLFRRVKASAAASGLKLNDFVSAALQAALRNEEEGAPIALDARERHRLVMREHFRRMDAGRSPHEPVGRIDRDALHDRHA